MRALFLDSGGVITRLLKSKPHVFAEACARQGLSVPVKKCAGAFGAADRLLEERKDQLLSDYGTFRRAYMDALRLHTGLGSRLEAVFRDYMDLLQSPRFRSLFEDVVPVLEELRNTSLHLGVLSNASRELVPLLFSLGVAKYFDGIIVSELAGCEKPQAQIFTTAVEAFEVSPQEALHIGDSYYHDYLGATRAGLRAVLLDRRGVSSRDIPTIRSLRELPSMLPALDEGNR